MNTSFSPFLFSSQTHPSPSHGPLLCFMACLQRSRSPAAQSQCWAGAGDANSLIKSSSACLPWVEAANRNRFPHPPPLFWFACLSRPIVMAGYGCVTGSIWIPKRVANSSWLHRRYLRVLYLEHFYPEAVKNGCSQGFLMKGILESPVETASARPITMQHWWGAVWEWKGEGDATRPREEGRGRGETQGMSACV